MKRIITTLLFMGLLFAFNAPLFSQSYGLFTEKPGYKINGEFLTDPALSGAYIGTDKNAKVSFITSGHADSVYFGQNAIHATFTDNPEGKDRLEFKVTAAADLSLFNAGELVFYIKLLDTLNMHFEVNANRDGSGEVKGTDVSMETFGLNRMDTINWQKITIDLSAPIGKNSFNYNMFESFGFRSRGNACNFLIDEMHVVYYGAYGMYTEKVGWIADGNFLTDPALTGAYIGVDKNAKVSFITSGHADSVYFGKNAIHATFTDNPEGKDRLEFKVTSDADLSPFNAGELVFYMKLLDTLNMHFEVNANRDGSGEVKGTDISMETFGLNRMDTINWQKITIDLSAPIGKNSFNYNMFESFGFRSRGNACNFLIDEMHVKLSGSYGFHADKPGYRVDGDFMTDPGLTGPNIKSEKNATVNLITNGHADSVYFGMNSIYAKLTDNPEGKDRLIFKVDEDADMSFINNGMLTFWIKLLAPTTDINFEVSANRNNAGSAKGTDVSMKNYYGLDVLNDSTWQKIVINLSEPIGNDNFDYNIFESFSFRSKGNASEFLIDEMHVSLTSPLSRYVKKLSNVATLDDLSVSSGTLTPAFNSDVNSYTVLLPVGVSSVIVSATATDPNATISGLGLVDVSVGSATATVTVTAEDGITASIYVIVFSLDVTRVQEDIFAGVRVYPNPVSNELIIDLGNLEVNVIDIVNLTGQTVSSQIVQNERVIINVRDLIDGLYILSIDNKPHSKIIIRK